MRKQIILSFILSALVFKASATTIVHDPGLTIQDAAHEVVNLEMGKDRGRRSADTTQHAQHL